MYYQIYLLLAIFIYISLSYNFSLMFFKLWHFIEKRVSPLYHHKRYNRMFVYFFPAIHFSIYKFLKCSYITIKNNNCALNFMYCL